MSTTEPADSATGRARRDSVANLVYTTFRQRVDNPKHLFYLFPPDYRKQVVQFDPGEEHRTNMFKRRNSLRLSTRSEGGSRSKWGRRKQSVADVTAPPANDVPSGTKLVRSRSQSVPMVKREPSDGDEEGPSRLQLRRSTNAYLELMWPRFFGSNRDIHDASERNLSRRHSEAACVHSRHNSGGGGSGSHSRHNSGGGSNSSRHNSDSMTVLQEEGGLHDSGIHGGSSRSSLTSVTSVGDVFLDDEITPASSTHSLHNLKPEVEMRRRAASQSYLQHRANHNLLKSTSERDRDEQILNPQALLLSSTGEGHGTGLPPRPSSYSGIGNEREKEPVQKLSGRLSSGSQLGDELVRREGNGKKPASRPKSDVELRYEDVLDHLMWDVDIPVTPPPKPTHEQLTPPALSGVDAQINVTTDDVITPMSCNQSLQNMPSQPDAKMRRKAFAQSHSKQYSDVEQLGGARSRHIVETNLDDIPSHRTHKTADNQYSEQAQPAEINASRSMDQLNQEEQHLKPSHLPTNKSRMEEQENNPSRQSRRLSSSSLDGDLPISRSPRVDQLIPNPWYSRYSDSSLNQLDVTPRPENSEAGGTTSTDSDVVEGISNSNISGGDKKMPQAKDNAKLGNKQEGYSEEEYMGNDGHGGMLQATNDAKLNSDRMSKVHNNSEHYRMDQNNMVDTDRNETVYTFTSVVEWSKDNGKDKTSSPEGSKPNDDEDSTTYTFSSKVEWNKQSQRGDEKEPLLAQNSAEGASVSGIALEGREDSDAHLEAYLDDVIQKHSSIVLQTEADPQFAIGSAPVSSGDRIKRQISVGVHANPGTQVATRDDDIIRKQTNVGVSVGALSTDANMANQHSHGQMERYNSLEDNIPRQTNFGVHTTLGPQNKGNNKDDLPSRGQMERWKSGNDREEDRPDSGITEKWTLLTESQSANIKVNSKSKGYGALRSGDYQDCRVRKGSVKLEKLKTKKVFTLCCFPFEFYW